MTAMSSSLHPDRLKRYKDIARLLFKYVAMVFFLAAAGGGAWLAFSIRSSDTPARRRR